MTPLPASSAPALEWVQFYLDQALAPIPIPFKSKNPGFDKWQAVRLERATVAEYFNGAPQNIGILLGEPSRGLVDIDLDCPEAVAVAATFLPATPCLFGRESRGATHWLYRVRPAMATTKFQDVEKGEDDEKSMLVELRGEGAQTIFPPSVHPSGECVTFLCTDFAPAEVDGAEILHRVRLLAIACLLGRHWPQEGGRHDAALGAAGLLLSLGIPVEDATLVVTAAARAGGDGEATKRRDDVRSTSERLRAGAVVVGGPALALALKGNGAAVIKTIKRWLGRNQPAEPRWQPPTSRPEIDTGNLGLAEMAAMAWQAIEDANKPPKVYRFGTALAWLAEDAAGQPQVEVMGQDHVRHHLAAVVTFVRWSAAPGRAPEKKPAFPPAALAADLLAVPHGALPRLSRLVRTPVFTADGRLLTESGYDAKTGLYMALPTGLAIPAIPEAPTAEELSRALTFLVDELLVDFPFLGAPDWAHALALLLTPLLRECISGDVPLFVVSKSTPRTGAGLLVKAISIVQEGAVAAPTTISAEEEEMRKRLTAALLRSPSLVLLDNLHGRLDSAALASILTSGGSWRDRLLGKTQQIIVPVRAAFVVTANNPSLSHEMAGRSVLIRLDAKTEDPSTRAGFRHPHLEDWTLEHRGRLLAAALTLAQGWIAAKRQRAAVTFGGFQDWAEVLGGVLETAGVPGFLDNRRQLFEQADEENLLIKGFLSDWRAAYGETPVSTKELLDNIAKDHALDIGAKNEQGMLVRLGRLVGGIIDRWYSLDDGSDTWAVKRVGRKAGGVAWQLRRGGSGGSGG